MQDGLIQLFYRFRSVVYRGETVLCNCCDGSYAQFLPPFDECPGCGSQARQRLMLLYTTNSTDLFSRNSRLLHFAPEMCLEEKFKSTPCIDYVSADLSMPRAMEKVDITQTHFPDCSFDVILCSHVLEHIPDDAKAMRELYRVLTKGGWAILQVPMDHSRQDTYEDFSITDPVERAKHFGRYDHCRLYGMDYRDRLEKAGFEVKINAYVETFSNAEVEKYGLDRLEKIYICRKV